MTSAGSEAGRQDDDAACWAVPTRTGLSQVIREVNRANHIYSMENVFFF